MSAKITKDFSGLEQLRLTLDSFGQDIGLGGGMSISVGFVGRNGRVTYKNGTTVATVALYNEFGTKNADGSVRTPARAFMRHTMETRREEIATFTARIWTRLLAGKIAPLDSQKLIARFTARLIRNSILTAVSWAKKNADSVIKRKGRNAPLRDLELMLRSVSWAVTSTTGAVLAQGKA